MLIFDIILGMLILSGISMACLGLYSRRFADRIPAAVPYMLLMLSAAAWAILYALDLLSGSLQLKVLFHNLRFLVMPFIAVIEVWLVLAFVKRTEWLRRDWATAVLIIPIAAAFLGISSPLHTLFRYNFSIDSSGPVTVLQYTESPFYSLYILYSLLLLILAIVILIVESRKRGTLWTEQTILLFLALIIPTVINYLFVFGITPVPGINMTAPLLWVAAILYTVSLFRYRFLDIVPIARSRLIETMSTPMLVLDMGGRIIDLNPAACSLFSTTHSVAVGKSVNEIAPDWQVFLSLCRSDGTNRSDLIRDQESGARSYTGSVELIRTLSGEPEARLVLLQDVTEQKLAEKRAVHLASFPELTPILILEADLHGSILYANPAILKATEMMGETDPRIFIQQDIRDRLNGTMIAKSMHEIREIEIHGKVFRENVYFTQEFSSLRVYANEITERKRAEEALKESGQRINFSLESADIGAWELDLVKHTAWRSLRHDQIFGYEELLPEWTYEMFLNHVLPEDRSIVDTKFGQAIEKFSDWEFECRIRRKDGAVCWIWAKGRPEYNDLHEPKKMFGLVQDITERKRAEEALWKSEEKYRMLFSNMQDGFAYCRMIYDSDGQPEDLIYLNVNQAFDRIIGIKNVTGKRFTEVFSGIRQAFPELFVIYGRVAWTGIPESFEIDFKPIEKWLHISVYSPEKEYFVAVFEDITERRRVEEALKESEEKFRAIFNSASDAIHIHEIGPDFTPGKFIDVNDVACRMLATSREEILSHSPPDFATEYHDPPLPVILRLFKTKGSATFETGHRRSDGVIVPVEINSHIINLQGKTVMLGIIRDITERKKAEQAIIRIAREWEETFNATSDGICLIDADQTIQRCNKRMIEILGGMKHEDLTGKPCWAIVHKTTGPIPECPFVSAKETLRRTKIEIPDGDLWFEVTADPILDSSGKFSGAVHIMRDITERKKAEDLIKHYNEELEQQVISRTEDLNASLDEKVILLREIHHRVKNNLQILISLLNLQSRTITDPQIKEALKESTQRIRAMSMVHEKLYSGSDLAHIDFISYLSSLAKSLVEFHHLGPGKVTLETTGENSMLDINTAIPLGLVMNELLSNALKHAFPGDRKGTIRITVKKTEGRLEISLADDGVGLPEGFDYTTSPSLGLRLVHILIEQLQGTIELDRMAGTKFTIVVKEKE
jgi:PAS domain S-box-containing protein